MIFPSTKAHWTLLLCILITLSLWLSFPSTPALAEDIDGIMPSGVHWLWKGISEPDVDTVFTPYDNAVKIYVQNGFYDYGPGKFLVSPVQLPGLIPLYQAYNPLFHDHLYTTNLQEAQLFGLPYGKMEGIIGYVAPKDSTLPGLKPLHRYYLEIETFHYLTNQYEDDYIGGYHRKYEGIIAQTFPYDSFYGTPLLIGPPTADINITCTAISGTQVNLAWSVQANHPRHSGTRLERRTENGSYVEIAVLDASATSFSDQNLTPNKTYYYRLTRFNQWGDAPAHEVYVSTPVMINVIFPNGGEGLDSDAATKIVWSTTAPSTGYVNLFYSTTEGLTWTPITSVPVPNSGEYSWTPPNTPSSRARVKADWLNGLINTPGNPTSVWASDSSNANFSILGKSGPAPTNPNNLVATALGSTKVNLTWKDNSTNETGFSVERKLAGESGYGLITTLGSNQTSYTDTSVLPKTSYTYRIRSWAGAKPSATSNEASVTTPASNLSSMLVPRVTIPAKLLPLPDEVGAPTVSLPPLHPTFRFSPLLGSKLATPTPAAPGGFRADSATSFSVGLAWQDLANNENGFKLERKTLNSNFSEIAMLPANAIGYIDFDVNADSQYLYRIKSFNASGSSSYSAEIHAETAPLEKPAVPPKNGTISIKLQIGNPVYSINQENLSMDAPPVIFEGRTLMPIRYVVEALDGTVNWDDNTKKVTVILGDQHIETWIGNSQAKVNSIEKAIDPDNPNVCPMIMSPGRTMLPLRFITENLGCQVDWDDATRGITITYGS